MYAEFSLRPSSAYNASTFKCLFRLCSPYNPHTAYGPLTLLVFLLSTLAATAQIRKGDYLLTLNSPFLEGLEFGVANNAQNLAGLTVVPESNSAMFYAAPILGYALSNRFVGGGRLGIVAVSEEGESVDFSLRLNPYLRYYAINRPGLMVFGELATEGKAASGVVQLSENYRAATGGHLPLATGVLLTPRLDYNFGDRRNSLTLGAGSELVLGAKDDGEDRSVATFARGSWMLGTQLISLEPAPRCLLWRGSPQRALFSYRPADHTRYRGGK